MRNFSRRSVVTIHSHWVFHHVTSAAPAGAFQRPDASSTLEMADKKSDTDTYYHYTDEKGAEGIKESGVIKKSSIDRGDAVFGDGTYLTRVPPTTSKYDIAVNNYDTRTEERVVERIVTSGNHTL